MPYDISLPQRLAQIQRATAGNVDLAPPVIIPFKGWMPDRSELGNPGETNATNVIPFSDGYRPMKAINARSQALTARCQGAVASRNSEGVVFTYAGDATKLYELTVAETVSDVSKSGGYSTSPDGQWEGVDFGGEIIMTNFDNEIQKKTVGAAGNFSNALTSDQTFKAKHLGVNGDFLVFGYTSDETDGEKPNRVRWLGINSTSDAEISATTQADYQDLPEGGAVRRIVGGRDYALVVQENLIRRMQYRGSPTVFRIYPIDRMRGTVLPGSVVGHGKRVAFYSEDGFMMNFGSGESQPIGSERVDKFFKDNFDKVYFSRMFSAIDPVNKLFMWSFPGESQSTAGEPNRIWIYHWVTDRWSEAEIDLQLVFSAFQPGKTLEDLDDISSTLAGLPFPLGSRAWAEGGLVLGGFNSSNVFSLFDGANLAATVETGEKQLFRNQRGQVNGIRPIANGGTITCAASTRDLQTASASFGSSSSINSDGVCPVTEEGRYHKIRLSIAAGGTWDYAQGVEIDAVPTGF